MPGTSRLLSRGFRALGGIGARGREGVHELPASTHPRDGRRDGVLVRIQVAEFLVIDQGFEGELLQRRIAYGNVIARIESLRDLRKP